MITETQLDVSALVLRAFYLTKRSLNMAFIGIYSLDTFEALALTDRESVQVSPGRMPMKIAVDITPSQVQAIVRHIRTKDNPLTQINIANLRFVCLRNETGSMTGMSNFNMESKRDSVALIDKSVYNIIHQHYTSQELLEGHHALQISAILKEEFIVIGICRADEESSLKILRALFVDPENQDDEIFENRMIEKESKSVNGNLLGEKEASFHFSFSSSSENGNDTDNLLKQPEQEVELRESALSPEERRELRQKRETSFCEDWRKATIKSIDALKLIGPFKQDDEYTDNQPLIDDIESIDIDEGVKAYSDSESDSEEMEADSVSKRKEGPRVIRRPSRATMV